MQLPGRSRRLYRHTNQLPFQTPMAIRTDHGVRFARATALFGLSKHLHQAPQVNRSSVVAGKTLGTKEISDGLWLMSFMPYDLGFFDRGA